MSLLLLMTTSLIISCGPLTVQIAGTYYYRTITSEAQAEGSTTITIGASRDIEEN